MRKMIVLFLAVCFCMGVAGCKSSAQIKNNVYKMQQTYPKLAKIMILPSDSKVEVGKTVTLTAQGIDTNGNEMWDIMPEWILSEKDMKIGSLNTYEENEVVFIAKKIGTAVLSVKSNGIVSNTKIEVVKAAAKAKKSHKK